MGVEAAVSVVVVPAAATLLKPPKNAFEVTFALASRNTTLLAPEDAVTPVPPKPTASVPPIVMAPVVGVAGVKPVELPLNDVTPDVPEALMVPPDKSNPEPTVIAEGAAATVPELPSSVLVPMLETLMVLLLVIVMSEPPTRDVIPAFDIVPAVTANPLPTITPPRVEVVAWATLIEPVVVMVPPVVPVPPTTLVTVPVPYPVASKVPLENVRCDPRGMAAGTAETVPALPTRFPATIAEREIVPVVVIGPPVTRPEVAMFVTVPVPPLVAVSVPLFIVRPLRAIAPDVPPIDKTPLLLTVTAAEPLNVDAADNPVPNVRAFGVLAVIVPVPPRAIVDPLTITALLAKAVLGMAVKPVPIAPTVNVPTPVMPV